MSDPAPRLSLHYRLVLGTLRLLFRLLARVEVRGVENVPRSGPLILAANHVNTIEGPLVFCASPRHPMTALSKMEFRDTLVGRLVFTPMDPVYVTRGEVDRAALKETVRRLKAGEAFGIAPEGTRQRSARLAEGKEGIAYVATLSDATIVPIGTWGQERALSELKRFRRPVLHITFGEPIRLTADPTLSRKENLAAGTEQVMVAIARLLPPEYRGFYADHVARLAAPPEVAHG